MINEEAGVNKTIKEWSETLFGLLHKHGSFDGEKLTNNEATHITAMIIAALIFASRSDDEVFVRSFIKGYVSEMLKVYGIEDVKISYDKQEE